MIIKISEKNIQQAAEIHSITWQDSHKDFCSIRFIEQHNIQNQRIYLLNEINLGKEVFMLEEDYPVGIISIKNNLIENLYVLPDEQGKGYGTNLLLFAISKCKNEATLWVLSNNKRA